ncbi:MAG: extracellular solute-binding protein [Treponemataceae bacterium]|nr:MAG: extracellular solute-binding protein [Treponemataceae bacterium]
MKNLKKLSVVAFALIAALFVLGSCSKKTASTRDAGEISGSLTVWLDNDAWSEAVIAAFNQKYPDVTVNYQKVGSVDTRGKVSLDGPAGIGPDVFLMPHDHIGNAILDGLLEPFPADLAANYKGLLLDAAIETCTSAGELYAVPVSTENIAFFYNKDLLGGKPVPTSFEEIQQFAESYNDASQNKYALRWAVDDSYTNYFFLTAFGMELFGPDMDDYRSPGWDSEAARKGVDFHHSLKKYYPVKVADATYDATVGAFQRGEVPFTIVGPWGIEDAQKNGVNFGITKLPTINGVQPRCFSGSIIAAVSSYSQNFDAAFAFADFLVSLEGETILYDTTGKLAAYKDVSGIPGLKDDVYLKGIQEQAPYADPMPIIPEMSQAWDAQKALFTFTWDDQLTTAQAQAKAIETYDTALAVSGKSR